MEEDRVLQGENWLWRDLNCSVGSGAEPLLSGSKIPTIVGFSMSLRQLNG